MPSKGAEIKVQHNLNSDEIIGINIITRNGSQNNKILRSENDFNSQKTLYNWYVDNKYFVLIRPNKVYKEFIR